MVNGIYPDDHFDKKIRIRSDEELILASEIYLGLETRDHDALWRYISGKSAPRKIIAILTLLFGDKFLK